MHKRLIPIDYETRLITADHPAPKPVCLSYVEDGEEFILLADEIEDFLYAKLNNRKVCLVAHNMKFEMLVTYEWYPALREAIWQAYADKRLICTMVDEKIINNFANKQTQHRFDLATLTQKYLGVDISAGKAEPDAWRLRYAELEGVPLADWPQAAIDYSIQDSVYTLAIYEHQHMYRKPALSYKSTRADFVLGLAANRGMTVDSGRSALLEKELKEKLAPGYAFLEEMGFGALCPLTGKFKKKIKVFKEYIEENVEKVATTDKGSVKVTAEALSHYIPIEEADVNFQRVLSIFINMSVYEKILSTFIPALKNAAKEGGLIRTNYNPVVSTGRTSSSGSKLYPSANIQQMPREIKGVTFDIRACYKARDGFKLVSIDYGGLELCATAHQLNEVYGHSRMKDLLNEGDYPMDLHSRFAAQVMSMELNTKIDYVHFLEHKKEKKYALYRQICKALNLGFPGGIGYDVMRGQLFKFGIDIPKITLKGPDGKPVIAFNDRQAAYLVKVGRSRNLNLRTKRIGKRAWIFIVDELVGLKDQYYAMYPEIKTFLKETHNYFLTGEHKMQKNEFDEWEKEPLYKFNIAGMKRDNAMYTQFCNGFLMQSPSAQGAKQMLWEIGHEFRNNPDVELDAFIHDEIIVEVRENDQFEANVDRVSQIMLSSMQKVLPSVRLNVEAAAMTYWSKDGDGSFDRLYWMDPQCDELHHD